MRVRLCPPFGFRDSDAPQHIDRLLHGRAVRHAAVQRDGFRDLMTHGLQRVQRGHRFLKNHRDVVATHPLHLPFGQCQQVVALEADFAADDAAGRTGDQAQDGQCGDTFAATGFADDAQGFTGGDMIRHAVHRRHDTG